MCFQEEDVAALAAFKFLQTGHRFDEDGDRKLYLLLIFKNFEFSAETLIIEKIWGHRLLENGKRVYNVQFVNWAHPLWWHEMKAPEMKVNLLKLPNRC